MKSITARFALISILFFANALAYAGTTGNKTNEFEITPIENLHLGKSIEKVWTINYSDLVKPVTITMHTVASGKVFIVRSNFLEVIYAIDKDGFGVRKMDPSMKEVPDRYTSSILNKKQLRAQRILTTDLITDATALELIAGHLPDLINYQYLHLIY